VVGATKRGNGGHHVGEIDGEDEIRVNHDNQVTSHSMNRIFDSSITHV
jgi:hypothetical protein